jgi:hypothetical protein
MRRNDEHKGTSNRGFASMDQAKQRAIASKGGQSVPPEKRSFSQDPALAAQAGRKGGENVPPEGRSFSQNRELAAEAGRKGGQARSASSLAAAAKRRAAKTRALDAGKDGTRRQSQPSDKKNGPAGVGARKGASPQALLGQQPQESGRMPSPPASPGTSESFQPDEPEDRDPYGARGDDLEPDALSKSSTHSIYAGANARPHEAS